MEKQKNIPQLRFPEFEGEWEKKKLGEISSGVMYGMNAAAKEYDGVHKYIRITDIDENSREFCPNPLSSPDEKPDRRYKLKTGDIVFARTGASVGKSYLYKEEDGDLYFAGFLIRFTINKANPFFVYTQTLLRPYDKWIKIMSMRSGQPGVNAEEFKTLNLSFPSLSEQQKIASFFTAIDQKISQLKRKKTLLEQYKKGVMQKIFSQEIRFKDDSGQEFPKWEKKRLGSILKERNIQVPKSDEYPLMAFVAYKGVSHKGERYNREFLVNDGANKKYKQTEYGDFIYSSNNLETGSIGLNSFGSASISAVYSIFQIGKSCNPQFLSCYLVRKSFINKMTSYRQGVVYGQWRIHESDFLKIEEMIPCIEEQTKIANFLSAIDDKITQTQKQIEKAEVWKKGLMQQMFV